MKFRSSLLMIAALGMAALPLGGCASFDRAIGKTRVIPDEFDVVTNDPLAIPPDFALRPPRVGNGPEQLRAMQRTRETVFRAGDSEGQDAPLPAADKTMSSGERDLLKEAGALNTSPDIRQIVNADPTQGMPFDRSLVDKLLFWSGPTTPPSDQVINPSKEEARIRLAESVAKPGGPKTKLPADAVAPTFEHGTKKSGWFDWLF